MKLYHGTSERVARIAWEQGLSSRQFQGEHEDDRSRWDFPSGHDRIYLTNCYAAYFAMVAANDERWNDNGRWAIVEVDAEGLELFPDEDFLEQATRRAEIPVEDDGIGPPWAVLRDAGNDIRARSAWFRNYAHHFSHLAGDSLEHLGTCSVFDEVPPEHITRVVLFDPSASEGNKVAAGFAMDPQISILNYRFMRGKYQALLSWFLGAEVTTRLVQRMRHGEVVDEFRDGRAHVDGVPAEQAIERLFRVPAELVEALRQRQIEVWARRCGAPNHADWDKMTHGSDPM